jgi:ubiquinone/menaquinone biosynthesis C-methylase UbiE
MAVYLEPFIGQKDTVLDVGSGNGYMSYAITQKTRCQTTCLDVIDICIVGPKPILYDGTSIPFAPDSFSVVICICVLHHIKHKENIIVEMKRVSASRIIIVEDISRNLWDTLLGIWHRFISKIKYGSGYVVFKSDEGWKDLFAQNGLRVVHEEQIKRMVNWIHPVSRIMYVLEKV